MRSLEATESGTKTILIVDDVPANLEVVGRHLENHGYRTVVAQGGQEGIERALLVQPSLILLDVLMPGMDGFEACRHLKANESTRDIPVIFMTALSDTHDKIVGFSVGGADYITKPFQIEEVTARINLHLALSVAHKRLAAQNVLLQQEISVRQKVELALKDVNDALEARVARRTAELQATNVSLTQEIAERRQAEGLIRYMAHHDALTELPNRALLEDRLNQAIAQARRPRD